MSIEKCYGQMKRRFPKLRHGFEFKKPSDTANCIIATAVVYNICKRNYEVDIEASLDIEDEYYIAENSNGAGSDKRDAIAKSFI